jgi:hypothetical protein
MIQRILGPAGAWILPALIQDARAHQRRRQAALAKTAGLALVLALATAAGRGAGTNVQPLGSPDPAPSAIQSDVARTISSFDRAVAARDYAAACSMLDPGMGMTTVRVAMSAVGVRGDCPHRLAGFARMIGPTLLAKLQVASVDRIESGGSESQGFDASANIEVADRVIAQENMWFPIVGVSKANGHARALITCPPLLCAWRFLDEYPQLARADSAQS